MNFRTRCWRSDCTKHGLASILSRQVRALAISASVRFSIRMLSAIVTCGSVKPTRNARILDRSRFNPVARRDVEHAVTHIGLKDRCPSIRCLAQAPYRTFADWSLLSNSVDGDLASASGMSALDSAMYRSVQRSVAPVDRTPGHRGAV